MALLSEGVTLALLPVRLLESASGSALGPSESSSERGDAPWREVCSSPAVRRWPLQYSTLKRLKVIAVERVGTASKLSR